MSFVIVFKKGHTLRHNMAKNLNKDTVYRAAKPKEKDYMINDGSGLYLCVGQKGTKSWRFIYTFNKKDQN